MGKRHNLYDRRSAADYLEITLSNLNYHIRKGNLEYIPKVGKSGGRLLSKDALDKFKEAREAGLTAASRRIRTGEYSALTASKFLGITKAAVYKFVAQNRLHPKSKTPFYVFAEAELRRFQQERKAREERLKSLAENKQAESSSAVEGASV